MKYISMQDVVGAHPGFKIVVTYVPRLSVHWLVYGYRVSENGQRSMGRPRRRRVLFIKNIVVTFSKPDQLILDPFSETLSLAK